MLGLIKPLDSTRRLVHPSNNLCDHSNWSLGSPQCCLLSQVLDVSNLAAELIVFVSVQQLLCNKVKDVANIAQSPLL
jgi:hypothetical protein